MRKRKYNDEQLIDAVKNSISIRAVLSKLGKSIQGGGNYNQIYRDIQRLGLNVDHFRGKGYLKGRKNTWTRGIPVDKILIENSLYTSGNNLKKKLLKMGLLKNQCYECEQKPEWKGKILVMVLDHINGTNNDNRIENLRLLCPNCNSQQKTFAGRNIKYKKYRYFCNNCNKEIRKNKSGLCQVCLYNFCLTKRLCRNQIDKIGRPYIPLTDDILSRIRDVVKTISIVKIAKELNVSEAKLRLACKKNNIIIPHKSFLQKKLNITKEELIDLLKTKPVTGIAKMFGVCDGTIRKKCLEKGINWKEISKFSHKS